MDEKLSPALRPSCVAPFPEIPGNDLALLQALGTHSVKLVPKNYEMCALWLQWDNLYSRDPGAPVKTIECVKLVRIAVTKAGHLVVAGDTITILDDSSKRIFTHHIGHNPRVAVDAEERIWLCKYGFKNEHLFCHSKKGNLLYKITLPFIASSIAFSADGRILFSGYRIRPALTTEHENLIAFYSLTDDRFDIINMRGIALLVKVCCITGEIYVLRQTHISVLSPDGGERLRDICKQTTRLRTMELTGNRHVITSELMGSRISVWTDQGDLICRWAPLSAQVYQICVLPYGKVAVCAKKEILKNEIQIFNLYN